MAIGSAIAGAGRFLSRLLDLAAVIILARLLTPEDFGLVAIGIGTLAVVNAFTDLPVTQALVQKVEIEPRDYDTAFTLGFIRGAMVFALMVAASVPLAAVYDEPRLAPVVAALGLVPLVFALGSPAFMNYQRALRFAPGVLNELAGRAIALALTACVAWFTRSYWALIIPAMTTPAVLAGASHIWAPYRPRFTLAKYRSFISFTGWISLSQMINGINLQSDRLFLGWLLGKPTLGQYSVGNDVATSATYSLAAPLTTVLFAGFSRVQHDRERLLRTYKFGQQALMAALLPLGVGLAVLSDRIVSSLLGDGWELAAMVILFIAPVIALQMLTVATEALCMGVGATRAIFLRNVAAFFIRTPGTIVAAAIFGLVGALIARVVASILIILINLRLVSRLLNYSIVAQIVLCWRSFVSVVVMAVCVFAAENVLAGESTTLVEIAELLGLIALGAGIYVLTHAGLWVMAGRPAGPEALILAQAQRLLGQVTHRRA